MKRRWAHILTFVVCALAAMGCPKAEQAPVTTGTMTTTLLGYFRDVACPECGATIRINLSGQPENAESSHCTCPNCFSSCNVPAVPPKEGGQP